MSSIQSLLHDARFAGRLLVKDRSFTLTALLTLVVCIGANAAIFSIVRSVLLKPLPVPGADRLVTIYNAYPNAGAPRASNAVPDYFDRLQGTSVFDELAVYRRQGLTFGAKEGAQRAIAVRATPSFFRMVSAAPIAGRVFTEQEGEPGHEMNVLLGYGLWQREFGGDRSVVGKTVRLSGVPYEVVGVLPADFKFLWNDVELWVPAAFTPQQKSDDERHSNNWQMIGRLKAGASLAQAQHELDAINAQNDARFPQFRQVLKDAGFHTTAANLQADVVRDVQSVLYLLWGGVFFVLLIGAVNIANLVLVRSTARTRELATRHAIGADLSRLRRQILTETSLLSLIGGALGLAAGWWALRSLSVLHLEDIPRGFEIQLDPVTAGVIVALAVIVGLLLGLLPVVRLSRLNLNAALRDEGRSGTAGRRTALMRRVLATAQVAIAFVLLVGAGLLLASFKEVLRIDPGFDPSGVVTGAINLPQAAYRDDAAVVGLTDRLLASIRQVPGVEVAGAVDVVPMGGDSNSSVILAEGYVMKPGESLISPARTAVSPGYFETMRVPLVRGRFFDARDTATSPLVVIVDERLAAKFWPGQDPIGRRMYAPQDGADLFKVGPNTRFHSVVGVVKEVQILGLATGIEPVGAYYFPMAWSPSRGLVLTVRASVDPESLIPQLRKRLAEIDPELPLYNIRTMEERVDAALVGRRVPMLIGSAFAAVALLLSAIGIYGVLAYGVSERRREIGIRMALGSSSREIFGLVLGDGLRILAVGLAIGLAGTFGLARVIETLLYGVRPMDPAVMSIVALVLAAVALVAVLIPARRASKVNPMVALNQ